MLLGVGSAPVLGDEEGDGVPVAELDAVGVREGLPVPVTLEEAMLVAVAVALGVSVDVIKGYAVTVPYTEKS